MEGDAEVLVKNGSNDNEDEEPSAGRYITNDVDLIAPCTNKLPCPLTLNPSKALRFCTFGQNVEGIGAGRKQEKITYLVVGKKVGNAKGHALEESNMLPGIKSQLLDSARITRSPRKNQGHVIFEACHDGEISSVNITKTSHGKSVYKSSRKAKWGGIWALGDFEEDEYYYEREEEGDGLMEDMGAPYGAEGESEEAKFRRERLLRERVEKYAPFDLRNPEFKDYK